MMHIKFRIPEILFGAILMVAIFAMGAVFESSRYQNTNQTTESNSTRIENNFSDVKITDWFTLALTAFLVVSNFLLWKAAKRSAKIAERTLTDLERPWTLIIDASTDGLFVNPPFVEIEKGNFGRTTGTVKGIRAGFRISGSEINACSIPMTEKPLEEVGNALVPTTRYTSKIFFKPYTSDAVANGIQAGMSNFVLRAVLEYRGLTDTTYETGFCFRYEAERNRFVRYGGEKYNYTK